MKEIKFRAFIDNKDAYACFGLLGRMHYAMIPIARIAYENPEMIKNLEVIGNIYENPDLLKEAYAQPNV